ncbi:Asp-tRNA(Asn)/Glu-tRNA(Gln) amidotransferase GatCAB subunit A, partial [Candidatus Saccharibacteria bacterium]
MSQWKAVAELAKDVQAGRTRAIDLVEQSLQAIEDHAEYQAVIATLAERARKRAAHIDKQIAGGKTVGRLAGVPFIAKDNLLVYGADATAGSAILRGFDPPYQATVINRLEAEGAICVAKANQDAFG